MFYSERKILIVEDDPGWRKSIMRCDFLQNLDKNCPNSIAIAENPDEAEKLIRSRKFDLAITDFMLDEDKTQFPWRNLARSLQKYQIPIIVVSAYIDDVNLMTEMINEYNVVGIFHKGQLDLCKLGKRMENILGSVCYRKNNEPTVSAHTGKISILHISDLHFGTSHRFQPNKDLPADDIPTLGGLLSHDLENNNILVDILVISGDITNIGSSDEFESALNEIEYLQRIFDISLENIIIVPGNHDITWQSDNSGNTASKAAYRFFYRGLYGKYPEEDDRFFHIQFIEKKNVLIAGLDSCVLEKPDRAGIGFIGHKQRSLLKEKIREIEKDHPDCLKIAAMHHHLLPVEQDLHIPKEDKNFSLVMDASMVLRDLYDLNFAAILHGHKHQPFCADIRLYGTERQSPMAIIGSGSTGAERGELGEISKNHYNIIEIETSDAGVEFTIQGRIYNNEKFNDYDIPIKIDLGHGIGMLRNGYEIT